MLGVDSKERDRGIDRCFHSRGKFCSLPLTTLSSTSQLCRTRGADYTCAP